MKKAPAHTPDLSVGPADDFGYLLSPEGAAWTYYSTQTWENSSLTRVKFTIYDENNKQVGAIDCDLSEALPGSTGINSVALNPCVTKKFFNIDDNYEVMVFMHGTTADYMGMLANQVYTLRAGTESTTPVCTIPGNMMLDVNTATDRWGENFYMLFQDEGEDADGNLVVNYHVYSKASWGTPNEPTLLHTFTQNYDYISQSGNEVFSCFMTNHNGKPVYATAVCEKPFFDPSVSIFAEPVVMPDNHYIITLYDEEFREISTTSIPMEQNEDFLYTFYAIGALNYEDDLNFGVYTESADEPAFVITRQNYRAASDDFVDTYVVYNVHGEVINVIAEEVESSIDMSDIPGLEQQILFFSPSGQGYTATAVNLPSCTVAAAFEMVREDYTLTSSIDRVAARCNDGYRYVCSVSGGQVNDKDEVVHRIAELNADGSLHRMDSINLGTDVVYAVPYIDASVLNPYLFNSTPEREYMFLVKRLINPLGTATDEAFRLVDPSGKILLEYTSDRTMGGVLMNIAVINHDFTPTLSVIYFDNSTSRYTYTTHRTFLPLESFTAGGSGTKADPWLISTPGDWMMMGRNLAAHYRVVADLDFTEHPAFNGFTDTFSGSVDGGGHHISGLSLRDAAMFGTMFQGCIKSLVLDSPTLHISGGYGEHSLLVADVTGSEANPATISGVHIISPVVTAPEEFTGDFGCVAGFASSYTRISECSVQDATVSLPGAVSVGGMVGSLRTSSSVTSCMASGTFTGHNNVGGLVGEAISGNEPITDCHFVGSLTAHNTVGGIAGMSKRSPITRCHFDGDITATATEGRAAAGGIVGHLTTLFSGSDSQKPLQGNVATLRSLSVEPGVTAAHRIAGRTSTDEDPGLDTSNSSFDWQNWDGDMDAPGLPLLHWPTEANIARNYVAGGFVAPVDATLGGDDHATTEGCTIAAPTAELLAELGYSFGTDAAAPWREGSHALPQLWFEDTVFGLVTDTPLLTLTEGVEATVTFTALGGSAEGIELTSSNPEAVSVALTSVEGSVATVTLTCHSVGQATITATLGAHSAVAQVSALSSIFDVIAPDSSADAMAPVLWFDLSGKRVSAPAPGSVYIRRQGSTATKVLVR